MGKKRKIAIAALLGLAVVIAGVWVAAQFYIIQIQCEPIFQRGSYVKTLQHSIECTNRFLYSSAPESFFYKRGTDPFDFYMDEEDSCWPRYVFDRNQGVWIIVPYWLMLLIVIIPAGLLWHFRPRLTNSLHCPYCNYNLTGNTTGVCPECGKAAAK